MSGWEAKPGWTCSWEGLRSYSTPVPEKSSRAVSSHLDNANLLPFLPVLWMEAMDGQSPRARWGQQPLALLTLPNHLGIKPETRDLRLLRHQFLTMAGLGYSNPGSEAARPSHPLAWS